MRIWIYIIGYYRVIKYMYLEAYSPEDLCKPITMLNKTIEHTNRIHVSINSAIITDIRYVRSYVYLLFCQFYRFTTLCGRVYEVPGVLDHWIRTLYRATTWIVGFIRTPKYIYRWSCDALWLVTLLFQEGSFNHEPRTSFSRLFCSFRYLREIFRQGL